MSTADLASPDRRRISVPTAPRSAMRSLHPAVQGLRLAIVVILLCALVFYAVASWHWQMMVDSPVMHYVNFLMAHGMQPYRTITDMNLPGSYLTDAFEMRAFGPGDLALRIYVLFLGAVLIAAMMVIAWPVDWLAGLYAGAFFVLLQGAEGPKLAAEREQVMTTLIFVGYALLFTAVRRRQPILAFGFGLLAGLAATIKPTVILLPVAVAILLWFALRHRRIAAAPYLLWSTLGVLLGLGTSVLFLLHFRVFGAFFYILHNILPAYASLIHPTAWQMVKTLMPVNVALLLVLGFVAWLGNRRKGDGWDWERWALVLGALMGIVSYLAQNKGFLHHRYLFLCFLLLLLGLEFTAALRSTGTARFAGIAALAISVFVLVPRYLTFIRHIPASSDYTQQLEADLRALGGPRLQRKVLCMDLVDGCLNSLYHLGLVENTGYTGDLLLFSPVDGRSVRYYRDQMVQLQASDPAEIIVVSNEWLERPNTFDKLDTWPWFEHYLAQHYTQRVSRTFPTEGRTAPASPTDNAPPPAYRLYLRNGL